MGVYTIGIDVGTTGTKSVLLEAGRGIVAQANRAADLFSPHAGWAEADPAQWAANVHQTIAEVLSTAGVAASDVAAVSASGMVPAVVVCDADGKPLRRAILQNDARASVEVDELARQLADVDLVHRTGSALTQQSVAPTLAWLQRHEPDVWARASFVVGSYDFVLMSLGARPHVEQNWAIESGLFALDGEPMDAVFQAAHVEPRRIPPSVVPGAVVGAIDAAAADRTGLAVGTPLVVGGADHVLSAFAAGVERPGDWLVKLGGAGDILVAADRPVVDERIYLDAHPRPGGWLPNGCMATSGSLIRWYQALVGESDFGVLEGEAARAAAGDVLCLPYFLGEKSPLHDPDLRGAFVGLHLGHSRGDLYRAVLEGIAFGFRHHVEVFTEMGLPLDRVMITNGGSRSRIWKQIHAEILGTEMFPIVDHPGASLGAAIIAGIGAGEIAGWDGVHDYLTLDTPVEPDPGNVRLYDERYAEWRALGGALAPVSHRISARNRP
ncbi:carbohydrate kinase [Microbacterium mangrovi]|uniref:Carbohydrate kinase n=1 Tax=Microbacterium mangrovi TaxID=1348253 RepID=A0A0B2A103_9MICO|nr:FGGY family carbohydrate kinase [Microbacterium mangrovi]KHK95497.1 carbohydrate kinase [Microbacterium mangrovi]